MARPLTKVQKNGQPYARRPPIEAALALALTQSLATLETRAQLSGSSRDHLPSEVLVHLIREARRRGDNLAMSTLVPLLLARCEVKLRRKTNDDHVVDEVLGRIAEMIAADGHGRNPHSLDFFEVRFNRAFKALRLTVQMPASRREQVVRVPTLALADSGIEPTETSRPWDGRLSTPEESARSEQVLLRIRGLPEHLRNAVVLVHGLDYKIESTDPNHETAATRCGVTGRTIRNYLAEAETLLKDFKEDS